MVTPGDEVAIERWLQGLEVLLAILLCGTDPMIGKWFSLCFKVRGLVLGLVCHKLLPRSWKVMFKKQLLTALRKAAADDAVGGDAGLTDAPDVQRRARVRKVSTFWNREDLTGLLMAVLSSSHKMERTHFDLYVRDVARKSLAHRRKDNMVASTDAMVTQAEHSECIGSGTKLGTAVGSPSIAIDGCAGARNLVLGEGQEVAQESAKAPSEPVVDSELPGFAESIADIVLECGVDALGGSEVDSDSSSSAEEPLGLCSASVCPAALDVVSDSVEDDDSAFEGLGHLAGDALDALQSASPCELPSTCDAGHGVVYSSVAGTTSAAANRTTDDDTTLGGRSASKFGLWSMLADDTPNGVRAQTHARLQQMLAPGSDLELCTGCLASVRPLKTTQARGLVVSQSADFSVREDSHWDAFPQAWAKGRIHGMQSVIDIVSDLNDCCLDGGATRKARANFGLELFKLVEWADAIESLDKDDSTVTTTENERQHGRLLVGYGAKLRSLIENMCRGFLKEWQIEHRAAGLGPETPVQPTERIRQVMQHIKQGDEVTGKKRVGNGSARLMFQMARDHAAKVEAGNIRRPWLVYLSSMKRFGKEWDEMPHDHPEKLRYVKLYEDSRSDDSFDKIVQRHLPDVPVDDQLARFFDAHPKSLGGFGSRELPLSVAVLDEFRQASGHTGLQDFANEIREGGIASRIMAPKEGDVKCHADAHLVYTCNFARFVLLYVSRVQEVLHNH